MSEGAEQRSESNQVPNIDRASVPREKVTDYLLSTEHPVGRHKAHFFVRFGFSLVEWERLAAALVRHLSSQVVTNVETTAFGMRYVVEGIMPTPDGRSPHVRTVWFVDTGAEAPRFVTAYPLEAGR